MANLDVIRRLTVQMEARGDDRAAAALNKVADAQGRVVQSGEAMAVASDKASKGVLSAADKAERLERTLVPAAKQAHDLARALSTIQAPGAERLGEERLQRMLDAAIARTDEWKNSQRELAEEQRRTDAAMADYANRAARRTEEQIQREQRLLQLRHEQASATFGADVRRLTGVDGPRATDNGATYSALADELQRMETLERQRAEAIGQAFTQGLNDSFRMNAHAIDMGATYSALEEEMDRLEEIAKARGAHIAQTSQQAIAQLTGQNRGRAVDNGATFSALAEGAADYDRQMRLVNEMLQKADPLGQEMERLAKAQAAYNTALAAGEISQDQFNTLMEYSRQRVDVLSRGLGNDGMASNLRLASHQWQNLGFQINDIATMLASGSSPFQVLATQGGQVYQILADARGGIAGGMRAVTTAALAASTSVGALAAGLGIVAVAGIAAANSFRSTQRELQIALNGIGAGSGATVGSLNQIAETAASASDISVRSAREMAAAFASSGKISSDQFVGLTEATKDFAKAFGLDLPEATAEIAKAMADPAKGADELNARLGFLDDKTRQHIRTLADQGDRTRAQAVLFDNLRRATENLTTDVNVLADAWKEVKEAISDAWNAFGQRANRFLGGGTTEELLAQAKKELEDLRAQRAGPLGVLEYLPGPRGLAEDSERQLTQRIAELEKKLSDAAKRGVDVLNNELSLRAGEVIRSVISDLDELQTLRSKRETLEKALSDPAVLEKLGMSAEDAHRALQRLTYATDNFKTAAQRATEDSRLELQGIAARTVAQRAQVEADKAYLQVMRESRDQVLASVSAEAARNRVIAEANRQAQDAAREAREAAGLIGLKPYQRALQELENQTRRNREQYGTGGARTSRYEPTTTGSTIAAYASLQSGPGIRVQGLDASFSENLRRLAAAVPGIAVTSGYRSPERQAQLWATALQKYGSAEKARKWVAPPGRSNHGRGLAADLSYASPAVRAEAHRRAGEFGLNFPLGNEPWHIEPIGIRGKRNPSIRYGTRGQTVTIPDDAMSFKAGAAPQVLKVGSSTPAILGDNANLIDQAQADQRRVLEDQYLAGPLREANEQLDQQIALNKRSAETFMMTTGQITAAAEAQRLKNEYDRLGVTLTPQLIADIDAYGKRAGEAAMEVEALAERQRMLEELGDVGKDALKGFISDLRAGKSGAEALANSLERVADKLLDMAIDSIFSNKAGGGFGGLLQSLIGGLGGGTPSIPTMAQGGFGPELHGGGLVGRDGKMRYIHPAYFENAPRYHAGLRPDEVPSILQRGEWVLSRDDVAGIKAAGRAGGSDRPNVNVNVINNHGGAQVETRQGPDGSIDVVVDALEGRMASKAARGHGPLYKASTARAGGRTLRG